MDRLRPFAQLNAKRALIKQSMWMFDGWYLLVIWHGSRSCESYAIERRGSANSIRFMSKKSAEAKSAPLNSTRAGNRFGGIEISNSLSYLLQLPITCACGLLEMRHLRGVGWAPYLPWQNEPSSVLASGTYCLKWQKVALSPPHVGELGLRSVIFRCLSRTPGPLVLLC